MQRRNARLRREYLYKRSLEGKEKEEHDRKEQVRAALASGAPLPGDVAKDAEALKAAADLEDDRTAQLRVRARARVVSCAPWLAHRAATLHASPPLGARFS